MVCRLKDGYINDKMGNKAKGLITLKSQGFNVPDGIVLDSDVYDEIVGFNGIGDKIEELLEDLGTDYDADDISDISKNISELFSNAQLTEDVICVLNTDIHDGVKYAVRSSGIQEDLAGYSFAGQYDTYLDVEGKDNVINAILKCYRSLFSVNVLTYLLDNDFSFEDLKMAVIVEKMVDSDLSGVVFTINPITGNDKEIVAEVIIGQGEQYVSGRVNATTYYYNWYEDKYREVEEELIDKDVLSDLMNKALAIQVSYGYPCDIEYTIKDNVIYFLQVRAITKINYTDYDRVWTTANFKDGGVSSTVCTEFMYSLYEYVWQYIMPKYLRDAKLVSKYAMPERLINMYFGRPYWDLTTVKGGASTAPGFKEREFDAQYSIRANYEGDGLVTEYTPSTLVRGLQIINAQRKIVEEFNENIEEHRKKCMDVYDEYINEYGDLSDIKDIENKWVELIKEHYLRSEANYFWLIYVNTIEQAINKGFYLKYANEIEYLGLISGIDNISHMRPLIMAWDISREIRNNPKEYEYWCEISVKDIVKRITNDSEYMPSIADFIKEYGYHSNREIDVTYPCYDEDLKYVVEIIKEQVKLEEQYDPRVEINKQKEKYEKILDKIKNKVSKNKYTRVKEKLDKMRKMLWWREELKDISTRYYYLIRKYTLMLARKYVELDILGEENEIWNLSMKDIIDFIHKDISASDLKHVIENNKKYYRSFKNYENETEIGTVDYQNYSTNKDRGIYGVGCNNGIVTARARVIKDVSEIEKLEKNDILVTKFTDTGWTTKFAKLSGIVTEYGGILCHTAIVSREYGIPCIVCAYDAMKKIKDGELITINGTTGEIKIEKDSSAREDNENDTSI